MNEFSPFIKINGCFIVRNIAPSEKTLFIFNYPIPYQQERDLLMIPGLDESDIRGSLLKGELQHKLRAQEITVICSDIDLLQFNQNQKIFLQNAGITNGLQVGNGDLAVLKREDIQLIGAVNDINTVFTTPDGVFLYDVDHKIMIYKNGVRQLFLDDFFIAESGGPGTGYDTVILTVAPATAPLPSDVITADYYISNI